MRESPDLGKVEYAPLDDITDHRTPVDLRCERIYFAADHGICLRREVHILTAQTVATIVDANFQPQFTLRNDGIPSRARISPDGRVAAFTVFLTGHSYGDAQLSTATLLLDMAVGKTEKPAALGISAAGLMRRQRVFHYLRLPASFSSLLKRNHFVNAFFLFRLARRNLFVRRRCAARCTL